MLNRVSDIYELSNEGLAGGACIGKAQANCVITSSCQ